MVTFFDPLLLEVSATLEIPTPPDGARNTKLQACPTGKLLILGRTDGVILKIPIPELNKIDLTLLAVRRTGPGGGEATTPGGNGSQEQSGGVLCASCGTPNLVLQCTAADGAASGYGSKLHHAWSQQRGLLAIVNARNQAIVIQRNTDGTSSTLLREQLPEAAIVGVSWDPSTQSVLAIAIRHYGIALWDTKSDAGVQMWSGTRKQAQTSPSRTSHRPVTPSPPSSPLTRTPLAHAPSRRHGVQEHFCPLHGPIDTRLRSRLHLMEPRRAACCWYGGWHVCCVG